MHSGLDTELRLRVSTPADLAAVDALLSRSYPKLLKPDYPPSVLVTALPLISRAQPALLRSGTYYVVEDAGGAILGAGGWSRREGSERWVGHIRHLVTDDRHLRRGIAGALIAQCFEVARAAGIREMEAWSTRTAVPFYRAQGFRDLGPIDVPLRPGITFPSVRMRVTLV